MFTFASWLALSAHCAGPTEIVVRVSTDLPCSSLRGVSLAFGATGLGAERAAPSAVTYDCTDGMIGTLTAIPASGDTKTVAVRIAAGIDVDVQSCQADPSGCVVARRRLAFLPRTRLVVPVRLLDECKNVPCDAESTCVARGRCVDAALEPSRCIDPDTCVLDGEQRGAREGGVGDAMGTHDADTPLGDSAPPRDGSVHEGGADSGDGEGFVACDETPCTLPLAACCEVGPGRVCTVSGCTGRLITCDGPEDCGGATPFCCSLQNQTCVAECAGAAIVCRDERDCPLEAPACMIESSGYKTCN
jgi:hypothetical protein